MITREAAENWLAHHGVLGMKWGIRKDRLSSTRESADWTISKTGEISIKKGATLSRVVRNHSGLFGGKGSELKTGQLIYAAFKSKDIAAYEHFFGRSKSFLVKNASTVLKLQATEPLKAPGPKEATKLYFDMIKTDPEAYKTLRDNVHGLAKIQMGKALADPSGKEAYNLYTIALDSGNYNSKLQAVNLKYYSAVKKAGYNMLLDSSDASSEFDAPVIVLDGGKSLTVKSKYFVDKVSSENARLAFKQSQIDNGKTYLEKLGYI